MSVDEIELTSVGVDVGSSTSHLVFSKLTLQKDMKSSSRRFVIKKRDIIYEGNIIDTPLVDRYNIDVDAISSFFLEEYDNAGINPLDVDTGAVIVTGETAKKQNAAAIVASLSEDAGKFVSATAGPNFESLIAALGSGMTARSAETGKTILNVDIGGGTSNIAISKNGKVVSTACVSVGGRLVGFNGKSVQRIDDPARIVMDDLEMSYQLGDYVPEHDLEKIAAKFASILVEVMINPQRSDLAKKLMMTTDLDFSIPIDEISFSGGVSELIYGDQGNYNDIGQYLANQIVALKDQLGVPVYEPENKIRATVIGAGAYSLSISGSTSFLDQNIEFPVRNVPIIEVDVKRELLGNEHVIDEVKKSFERFDIIEGESCVGLYFQDPVRASYKELKVFAHAIARALPNSVNNRVPVILIFERDIANSVGNVIRREGTINEKLLTLDELDLKEGDWIDIGAPLVNGQVFPVTVKSLVFKQN